MVRLDVVFAVELDARLAWLTAAGKGGSQLSEVQKGLAAAAIELTERLLAAKLPILITSYAGRNACAPGLIEVMVADGFGA